MKDKDKINIFPIHLFLWRLNFFIAGSFPSSPRLAKGEWEVMVSP